MRESGYEPAATAHKRIAPGTANGPALIRWGCLPRDEFESVAETEGEPAAISYCIIRMAHALGECVRYADTKAAHALLLAACAAVERVAEMVNCQPDLMKACSRDQPSFPLLLPREMISRTKAVCQRWIKEWTDKLDIGAAMPASKKSFKAPEPWSTWMPIYFAVLEFVREPATREGLEREPGQIPEWMKEAAGLNLDANLDLKARRSWASVAWKMLLS